MINNCFNVIAMVLIAVSVTSSTPIPSEPHYQSPADKTNSLFNVSFDKQIETLNQINCQTFIHLLNILLLFILFCIL